MSNKKCPNIVFILADDLGWMDTALYGSDYFETPNIDRMAEHGIMFTNAYAANPLCSPTRASIQTGQYPARIGMTTACGHVPQEILETRLVNNNGQPSHKACTPNSVTRLDLRYPTIGKLFKEQPLTIQRRRPFRPSSAPLQRKTALRRSAWNLRGCPMK